MKILLLGGTTEGRQLAAALTGQGHEVTVCVATELGAEQIISHPAPCPEDGKKRGCPGTLQIRVGRMNAADMKTALEGCDLCVDATHPYALVVSALRYRFSCSP